jgi:hypothetical protein
MKSIQLAALLALTCYITQLAVADLVLQADFNGTAGGTGGNHDIVTLGGTGTLYDSEYRDEISATIRDGKLVVTDAGTQNANRRAGVLISPTTIENGFNAMFQDTSSINDWDTLNGGFDFLFQSTADSLDANTVRPIDIRFGQNNQLRLVVTTNASGPLVFELLDYSKETPSRLVTPSYDFTEYQPNTLYHVAFTCTTGPTGRISSKIYLAEGNTSISTKSTPVASRTSIGSFNINGDLTNNSIHIANLDTNVASILEYDSFRIYDEPPTEFTKVDIPEPATAVLRFGALTLLGTIVSKRHRAKA